MHVEIIHAWVSTAKVLLVIHDCVSEVVNYSVWLAISRSARGKGQQVSIINYGSTLKLSLLRGMCTLFIISHYYSIRQTTLSIHLINWINHRRVTDNYHSLLLTNDLFAGIQVLPSDYAWVLRLADTEETGNASALRKKRCNRMLCGIESTS